MNFWYDNSRPASCQVISRYLFVDYFSLTAHPVIVRIPYIIPHITALKYLDDVIQDVMLKELPLCFSQTCFSGDAVLKPFLRLWS